MMIYDLALGIDLVQLETVLNIVLQVCDYEQN
jgi:hypothetical protein